MADYTYGRITVTLPETLTIEDRAGSMTAQEMQRMAKARRGIGLVCEQVAEAMEQNPEVSVSGVTPEAVREAGAKADGLDAIITELEVALRVFKQQNLLNDSAAYELVRRVNDQVNVLAKYDPDVKAKFAALSAYFGAR